MKSFFPSLISASHLSRLLLFIYFAEAFGARRFVKAPRQLERSVYRGRFPGDSAGKDILRCILRRLENPVCRVLINWLLSAK